MQFLGVTRETWGSLVVALHGFELLLGGAIAALALLGYRRNRSRPMLILALGVGFLTFVQVGVSIVVGRMVPTYVVPVPHRLSELVGLVLIIYSIVLARRTGSTGGPTG